MKQLFRELWENDDGARYRTAVDVLEGRQRWLESGILDPAGATTPKAEGPANDAVRASRRGSAVSLMNGTSAIGWLVPE